MKIDTKAVLKNIKGEPFKDGEDDLTLGSAVGKILVVQKTANVWKQYRLSNLLASSEDSVDLEAEDIVFLKKAIEDNAKGEIPAFYPYVLGQCIDLLEAPKE